MIVAALGALVAFVIRDLVAVVKGARESSRCLARLSSIKGLSYGLLQYAADEDGRLPPRDAWMDASQPRLPHDLGPRCADAPKGAVGYAFNGGLSRAKTTELSDTVPLVYDSVNPIRNASDPFASLPSPGRHEGKDNVAYADGHTGSVVVQ